MDACIVWFRQDLRLDDNPAWKKGVESNRPLIPVYIHDSSLEGYASVGAASRWWLHHALEDLSRQLEGVGSRLILLSGSPEECLLELIEKTRAKSVYWNRCYEPHNIRISGKVKRKLESLELDAWSGNSALLKEPWELSTKAGSAYKVYTPYSKAAADVPDKSPVECSASPVCPENWPEGVSLDELKLLPEKAWDDGIAKAWDPTRKGALARMKEFLSGAVSSYSDKRNFPDCDGTSKLSPYLHFGQIGPREVVNAMVGLPDSSGKTVFYRELIWREFAYHVLYHFPDTPKRPLQKKYEDFPWRNDDAELQAWRQGKTGYPIVDAGMRQLWETGWMHNRVRMIVASFLVKHLLQSWEQGAEWFWDTLVDADLANNTLGWQWAGGCGADAAPYFRVFNPIIQGRKFDPSGSYVRKFVPEIKNVPDDLIHSPWEMTESDQDQAGCRLGEDYPFPVIEHSFGRERALAALNSLK